MRWLGWAVVALCVSCGDPKRDSIIESLGDEDPGFEESEIHRPGQPCVACHSEYGGADPEMSIGGTLFTDPSRPEHEDDGLQLVPGHLVRIIDSAGKIVDIPTNRCGNFYAEKDAFDFAFPLRAELFREGEDGPERLEVMASRIGRDGSCGTCHTFPASPESPNVVFVPDGRLDEDIELPGPTDCPPPRFAPNLFNPEVSQ